MDNANANSMYIKLLLHMAAHLSSSVMWSTDIEKGKERKKLPAVANSGIYTDFIQRLKWLHVMGFYVNCQTQSEQQWAKQTFVIYREPFLCTALSP